MKPFLARLVPVLVLPVLLLLPAQPADAARLLPPKGKVLTGVSDNGTLQGFRNYTRATGKHPAVLQTFHPWGNKLELAYRRWQNAKVVPMLHISTADDETREELITPQEIATGAGDPYLWKMNRFFAEKKQRAYIRPLGEPNRCLNPYSAVTCSGTPRGGEHTQRWYRKAFQRIAVIVRGGMRTKMVNRKLWKLGMPNIKWGKAKKPEFMPKPKVAIVWSPLPAGSPMAPGNWPANYWPGKDFVDWAGTDFYSNYPFWEDLNRFMDGQPWRNKPVAMSEWGVTGYDDTRFVHRIFRWMKENPRVRMMNYYRGFGSSDPYSPYLYPRTINTIRKKLRHKRYVAYAKGYARR